MLLAVVITATALAIALGIFSIVYGQIIISRAAKESYLAFYSADTGMECALYYLGRKDSSVPGRNYWEPDDPCFIGTGGTCDIKCAGTSATGFLASPSVGTVATQSVYNGGIMDQRTFDFNLYKAPSPPTSPGVCSSVHIVSQFYSYPGHNFTKTVMTSSGKDTCVSGNSVVDRSIEYNSCPDISAPECQ